MQFIPNGPDVPDELLKAHEEGRLVFFCGAGISYPAGLPDFKGLVEEIYRRNGTTRTPIEQDAFSRGQYDATLDLLERRLPGQRFAVRRAIAESLKPKWRKKGATDTHSALLRLARSRDGAFRLVTTNFDGVFEVAAKRSKQKFESYAAPMLPIPKNSRWNGLVYLHGQLPKMADETALNRLIVTSGDFGLAYLTERWAARFVSELFRNYIVCFVGYSINDPVLRYMMDALAADRMLGENTPQAWALGAYGPGEEKAKFNEWEAKGVVPILYEVPSGGTDHSALHLTLRAWAETYRDGVLGKERIVVTHALARPASSTRQDDFVGRMLWALSDSSGLPAKRFADFNPVPSLDWLSGALSDERYGHDDLPRFGVAASPEVDRKLWFSFIRRPTPYSLAPRMMLVNSPGSSQWDSVMHHLARWLLRHLNDPALVLWVSQRGRKLHERWSWLIERELDRLHRLERDGKTSELEYIRSNAQNSIPGPLMRTVWRLLLNNRVQAPWRESSMYGWIECFKREGLTSTLRMQLRDLLSPALHLDTRISWGDEPKVVSEPNRIGDIFKWKLTPSADDARVLLKDFTNEAWKDALPTLLVDFQQNLLDNLDLMRELGEADERMDRSHWDLPSISDHQQNRGFREWVTIIELLRDSWLSVYSLDPSKANAVAQVWFDLPYPTFKRLAIFAASLSGSTPSSVWAEWLVIDSSWWLWSPTVMRETLRLLVTQGSRLASPDQERLEAAILEGPPRNMFREDLELDQWEKLKERAIWLRLAKLNVSGISLGKSASQCLASLSTSNPQWALAKNERDEFSIWSSGTGDQDYEEGREVDITPRRWQVLVSWLQRKSPDRSPFYEDTWRETCRTRFFHALYALCKLADDNVWPRDHWEEALQTWGEAGLVSRSWRYAAPLVGSMPDEILICLLHPVTWWLQSSSKSLNRHKDILLSLCKRVLALSRDVPPEATPGIDDTLLEPVTEAINHPVGHVTQALLEIFLKRQPNDSDHLPIEIESFFTELCDLNVAQFRHGRVLLGSRLISIFRVDPSWTERRLLPIFSWTANPAEARAVWEGFLWSPRLYKPLLIAVKEMFLETANHYKDLGEHARQYAAFLTYAALDSIEGYTAMDFRSSIALLPQEGLEECAQALAQALESAGDQKEEYWRNRILPFWQDVWPKSRDLATEGIAEDLMRLCVAAASDFPAALSAVQDWLRPIEHPDYVVHRLHESGLCKQYPEGALRLLNFAIDVQPWVPRDLAECLKSIVQADPMLSDDDRYRRLIVYSRQRES